jgi:hypothetical protein
MGSQRLHRWCLIVVVGLAGASAATASAADAPEFTFMGNRVLVDGFGGYGGQFNQHLYADISGPPADLPGLEAKVAGLHPQFARVFFNTTEWTFPDRMRSFVRVVRLAQRSGAQVNVTWQGSTPAFAEANMARFADVLADLVQPNGSLWVTLFNEPNSTSIPLERYEKIYRLLDGALRARGVRDRIRFMGGDLVGTTSPLGQSQGDWFAYMAAHMGDLLDAWSIHVFWDYWDTGKIERRLATEVKTIYERLPAEQRRPLYITEYGVRGLRSFEGEARSDPGSRADGVPIAEATAAAFQQGWFVVRAAELGYAGVLKWDLFNATYDAASQDYSAVGPGKAGWPLRPAYHLIRLLTMTTKPTWSVVEVAQAPGSAPAKLVAGYLSPAGNVTLIGLDTDGAQGFAPSIPISYSIGGLPPNKLFHLVFWNATGEGTNKDIGFVDSGPDGVLRFSAPLDAVFAATSAALDAQS